MGDGIFRDEALENVSAADDLEQALRLSTPLSWILLALTGLLIGGAVVWSTVADAPIKVSGQGILLSSHGIVEVVVGTEGLLVEVIAEPDVPVQADAVVAIIDQADIALELALAKAEFETARSHRDRIVEFHERERTAKILLSSERQRAAEQSAVMARERRKLLRERGEGLAKLKEKGFVAQDKLIANLVQISQTIDQIAQQENLVRSLQLEAGVDDVERERELLDISQKVDQLNRKLQALESKYSRNNVVRSPFAGRIVEVKANVGEYVTPGMAIFSLMREDSTEEIQDKLMAVIYVPPGDGKKVQVGMPVEISPSTVRKEEFGFLLGRVSHVAEVPSTTIGMMRTLKNDQLVETLSGDGAPFEIQVELLRDEATPTGYKWSSSVGPADMEINSGTPADAEVTVRSMRMISLVIPALERLFADEPVATDAPAAPEGK